LKERRQLLDELRDLLLVVETIDGNDIEAYATGTKLVPDPDAARREQDERACRRRRPSRRSRRPPCIPDLRGRRHPTGTPAARD
jgi:hypothetical protein